MTYLFDDDPPPSWNPLPAMLLVAAGWLALTQPWWSGAWTVPWDAKAHFYPQLQFLARSIASGDWPFWTPNVFSGWGQIADPQSLIFVPAFAILAFFDVDPSFVAMDMTVFGVLLVGGLALVVWFRDRRWHPAGAVVAALAFLWGASAYWRIQHTGQVVSYGLLPLAVMLLDRALIRQSIAYGFLAGIVAGIVAVGRDQIALLSLYVLIIQTVAFILGRPWRIVTALWPLVGGAVGGLLVVTVPVALTWLLAEESNRPLIDFIGAGRGSLHPAALITAFIADLFGQGSPKVDFWGPPTPAFGGAEYLAQNMVALYAGIIPALALVTVGICRGALLRREIAAFTFVGAFVILYALGWYTPAFRAFYDYLPGVKLYRRPADATFLIGFALAVLGGYCVHRLMGRDGEDDDEPSPAGRLIQAAALVAIFIVLPYAFARHANRMSEALLPWGIGAACALAGLIVLWLTRHAARASGFLAALIVALAMVGDLYLNNSPNESTAYPPITYRALLRNGDDPTIAFLKANTIDKRTPQRRDRIELVGLGFHWPNAPLVHGLESTNGYNPLRFKRYQAATGVRDHAALPDQRVFSALMPGYDSRLAELLGLRYIALGVPLAEVDKVSDPARLPLVAEIPADAAKGIAKSYIYENPRALPRVRFVPEARQADFAKLTETGQWPDGYDPARMTLIETAGIARGDVSLDPASYAQAVAITTYRNTEVALVVEAPTDGYVVLHDMWHPWWRASLDGQPTALLNADVLFRAVAVPKGRHVVRFTYPPFAGAVEDYQRLLGRL
jgi:hypothetical protein